jgi:hypothetical protein
VSVKGVFEVDQLHPVAALLPSLFVFNRNAFDQHAVKSPVVLDQAWVFGFGDLVDGVFQGGWRNARVEALQGLAQTVGQEGLGVGQCAPAPCRRGRCRGRGGPRSRSCGTS